LRHGVLFGFQRSFCTVPVECLKNRIYHDIPQTSSPKKNKRELRHGQWLSTVVDVEVAHIQTQIEAL
jgi:hypothetical protein